MTLNQIYERYPTKNDCIELLEKCFWDENPKCPYCSSKNQSKIRNENRYHCNWCGSAYSVTVKTIFHKTRCDFQKWFYIMLLMLKYNQIIEIRETSRRLKISTNTLALLIYKIRLEYIRNNEKIKLLIEKI